MDRRDALKLIGGAGLTGLAAPVMSGCAQPGTSGSSSNGLSPVRVGVLLPQSGVLKSDGDDLGNGFRLFLKVNDNRLGGRAANVVYVDEGQSADSGKAGLETLLEKEKVRVVTGIISSAVMAAVRPRIEAAKIPLVGSNGSPASVEGSEWIWRTSWSARDPGRALGRYVAQRAGGSVAVMAPDYAAGRAFVAGFVDMFVANGGRLEGDPRWTQFLPTPVNNFTAQLTEIKKSAAKAVFCFYAGELAVNFVKQYRQLAMPQTLYAVGSLTEGGTLRSEGNDAIGIYTAFNYSPDLDIEANRHFVAAYAREYNLTPSTYAMAAYDAAAIIDKAIIATGGDPTPQELNAAIGKVGQIRSPRGVWEFTENRTPVQKWYLRRVGVDGGTLANVVISELDTM